jgi:signal peptidase I
VILHIFKVANHSLYPAYRDGDFVVLSKIPIFLRGLRAGDVIVFDHPQHGRLIKIIERIEAGGKSLWVTGLSTDSIDSRRFGPIATRQVLGVVIWRVSPA